MDNSKSPKANSSSNIQLQLLQKRYLLKDKSGKVIETPDQMFRRVADAVAKAEGLYGATPAAIQSQAKEFYDFLSNGYFLPNSPTLMNAGRKNGVLSACFVLPIPDSIEGIFDTIKYTALIQKAGGGTGFTFDTLRPTGDIVSSSGGTTSGPISFWRVIAETTRAIQQGAHRRGANMGMMSLEHPDILNFITAKRDPEAFTNFNISVKATNEFMESLSREPDSPHIVKNPRTGKCYHIPKDINASKYSIQDLIPAETTDIPCYSKQDIWNMIIRGAHANGEPGICFIDIVNESNPTPHIGILYVTNPCGEQPLLYFEACNLGSIVVSRFVSSDGSGLDWDALGKTIDTAVRFLDDVIDANYYPIPEIREITLGNRKIGLGLMGFADALILLGTRYDSAKALKFALTLSEFIQKRAHQASEKLAWERGCFPNWNGSTWDTVNMRPMRNAAVTTIAPTGSISIIAGCSSGIEPIFKLAYEREALDGQKFNQLHPLIEKIGTRDGWLDDSVRKALFEAVPVNQIPGIPEEIAEVLVTAHEVAPQMHVRMQAAFQAHTDNAVSKTVNLPSDAKIEDVDTVFKLAYKLRCKGITVYRDQSRDNQVFSATHRSNQSGSHLNPRPRKTTGQTTKYRMGCGTLFVTVNKDEKGLCEVFANLGKAGGCPSQSEATCRAVSAALRSGVEPQVLIEQLKNIRCLSTIAERKTNKDINVLSCPDAIARALEEALGQTLEPVEISMIKKCRNCGFPLRKESGCDVCDNCLSSNCG